MLQNLKTRKARKRYTTIVFNSCRDHIELRKNKPQYYEGVDINFSNLLSAYLQENPVDAFYKVGFGKTFAEVKAMSDAETPENKSVN